MMYWKLATISSYLVRRSLLPLCWQDCKTDGAEKHTSEKDKQNGERILTHMGDEKKKRQKSYFIILKWTPSVKTFWIRACRATNLLILLNL